jgi:DNA-binding LytR/AlgR family response regulator
MIKCLILDDEPLARQVLRQYIEQLPSLELVGECKNAVQAAALLQTQPVDLLFADIQMPGLSGVEFVKTLPRLPKVIFTTAYREYALDGFDVNALDYLVKPFEFSRFLKAVNKLPIASQPVQTTAPQPLTIEESPFIFFKVGNKRVRIRLQDILYIESDKDYAKVYTVDGKMTYALQKIGYLEERLSGRFVRIHRSYLAAVDKINAFTASHVEIGERSLPIGHLYKQQVLALLERESNF